MDPVFLIVSIAVGLLIGILSGLLGIGGGMVMVPVFKLGFGMSAIGATATSLCTIIPTAVAGAITHLRQGTCIPILGLLAGIGGACLSPVGVHLASLSPGWAIMLAAAAVILYSSITMLRKALAPSDGPSSRSKIRSRTPEVRSANLSREPGPSEGAFDRSRVWLGLPIGAAAGLVAGYVGVGGGFLMVPLFVSLLGLSMKRASGTSLVAIAILAIPGAIYQLVLGNAQIVVALAILVGSIPGASLGARFAKRIPERSLRLAFGAALAACAILMVLQEVAVL